MAKLRAAIVIAIDLSLLTGYLILSHLNGTVIGDWINTIPFSLFPLVGAVLLARHPRNPVGYLVSTLGLSVLGASMLMEYAKLAQKAQPASLPLAGEAAWGAMLLWAIVLPCLIWIMLLFPDGRLPGRSWNLLGFLTVLFTLPVLFSLALFAWPNREFIILIETGQALPNPGIANLYRVYDIWDLAIILAIILSLVRLFIRFSRSRGIERQQLKWFVFGLSTIPVSLMLNELVSLTGSPAMRGVNDVLNIISITAFPVVMLIAITRYRLYDIDFIIRRTLLYSALTLTLAVTYFILVLMMQGLFTRRFGEQPEIIIVISTLLIATLFQPLRRRFQFIIDRRFYRSKYNAEQTMERLAARLQSGVDLEEIERDIIGIVDENFQPEQAELWLIQK